MEERSLPERGLPQKHDDDHSPQEYDAADYRDSSARLSCWYSDARSAFRLRRADPSARLEDGFMTKNERFRLEYVSTILYRIGYRLTGACSDIENATRNVDRLILKNDLDSLRLEISDACEILTDLLATSDDATDS
jgi:hypothetical protein